MKQLVAAVMAAIEAVGVAILGFTAILIPAGLLWLLTFGLAAPVSVVVGCSAAVWLWGHGLPLRIEVPAEQLYAAGIESNGVSLPLSLPLLGILAITLWGAVRAGSRAVTAARGDTQRLIFSAIGACGGAVFAAFSIATLGASLSPAGVFELTVKPALFYCLGFAAGVAGMYRREIKYCFEILLPERVAKKYPAAKTYLSPLVLAPRLALGVGAALTAVVSFAVTVGFATHFVTYIQISQGLQLDILGSAVLWFVQFLALPVAIIWGYAWFSGAGFAVGADTVFSPFTVTAGGIPAFPIFGTLPNSWGSFGFFAPLLVTVLAAIVGVRAKRITRLTTLQRLAVSAAATAIAGAVLTLLLSLARGAIGPERLATTGPHLPAAALLLTLEIFIGLAVGTVLLQPAVFGRGVTLERERIGMKVTGLLPSTRPGRKAAEKPARDTETAETGATDEVLVEPLSAVAERLKRLAQTADTAATADSAADTTEITDTADTADTADTQTRAPKPAPTGPHPAAREATQTPAETAPNSQADTDAAADGTVKYTTEDLLKTFEWQSDQAGRDKK